MAKIQNITTDTKSSSAFLTPHVKSHGRNRTFNNASHNVHTTQTTLPKPCDKEKKDIQNSEKGRINLYALRYVAGSILGGRTKSCGQVPIGNDVYYSKKPNSKIFVAGVETCCNSHACPTCALKILEQRRLAVYNILLAFRKMPSVAMGFLTLTVQHSYKDSFKTVYNWTYNAWLKTIQSRKYKELGKTFKKQFNKSGKEVFVRINGKKVVESDKYKHIGDVRAIETKISKDAGYHVHQHLAIVAECTEDELREYATAVIEIYLAEVNKWRSEKKGYANIKGQHYSPIYNVEGINNYISKWEVSAELTKSNSKTNSYKNSYTPFGLLDEILNRRGDQEHQQWCANIFKDYCNGIKRTRAISISSLLKKYFNTPTTETEFLEYMQSLNKTDEELMQDEAKEIQKEAKVLLTISRKLYLSIGKEKIHAHCLNEYEYGQGLVGLQMFLMELGIFTTYDEIMNKLWLDEELKNVQRKKIKINLN